MILEGVDLTSVARTLVDLGRTSAIDTTVAAGDAALHGHITSWSEILDALREARCTRDPRGRGGRCGCWMRAQRVQRKVSCGLA